MRRSWRSTGRRWTVRAIPLAEGDRIVRLTVQEDGTVILRVGKVELGQGIHTALTQIAIAELGFLDRFFQSQGTERDRIAGAHQVSLGGFGNVRKSMHDDGNLYFFLAVSRRGLLRCARGRCRICN